MADGVGFKEETDGEFAIGVCRALATETDGEEEFGVESV